MAFAMFTKIPMPRINWEKTNMRYMFAAFPLIGLVNGAVLYGWFRLADWLNFGTSLYAAGLTLLPIFLTGGIHLDGFCDTIDALSSHAAPERKREILKDPNAGAFAVIYLGVYLLAYFALCTELDRTPLSIFLLGGISIISRAAGALSSIAFNSSKGGGLLDTFRDSASSVTVWICTCFISAYSGWAGVGAVIYGNWSGVPAIIVTFACLIYVKIMSRRQFGGMSGDIAGFQIQLTELLALAAVVIF
jgi:adenosylcobinamide-GDP ribazoletransferase